VITGQAIGKIWLESVAEVVEEARWFAEEVIPDLSGLDRETRSSIETACGFEYTEGPAAYARCINSHLRSIGLKPGD
jgi:hypothetical protein